MKKSKLLELIQNKDMTKSYVLNVLINNFRKGLTKKNELYFSCSLITHDAMISGHKFNVEKNVLDKLIANQKKCYQITGNLKEFRNKLQFNIVDLKLINDEKKIHELIPTPPIAITKLEAEFLRFRDHIEDEDYAKLINDIFDENMTKNFFKLRAGIKKHHSVYGGLLWHTVSILRMAERVLKVYDFFKIDKSLLYAGIIMHDFGKIFEIGDFFSSSYTLKGNLIGHICIGSQIIYERGKKLNIPDNKVQLLQHVVLSSHGKFENGSPILPAIIEALIVSKLDDFDAKMGILYNEIFKVQANEYTDAFYLENDYKKRFYIHQKKDLDE